MNEKLMSDSFASERTTSPEPISDLDLDGVPWCLLCLDNHSPIPKYPLVALLIAIAAAIVAMIYVVK